MPNDAPALAPKPKKSVALSGVVAGNTALCTVGRTGNDLHYRGYDILDQHALQLVDASGPLPALPDELGSNEIQITVPVSYKLRKTT